MSINALRKGRHSITGQEYFVTFNTKNRKKWLRIPPFANIVARTIHYNANITLLAWVIMPDHVHMLFTLQQGSLANTIKSIKGVSSRHIAKTKKEFRWAAGYYDHALRNEESRQHIARYIVANPLRAGIVKSLSEYPWWNAVYL